MASIAPPRETASSNVVAPVEATHRIETIDIVRGVALYGIMAINVVDGFSVSIFQQFLPRNPALTGMDRIVEGLLRFLLDMKPERTANNLK